MWGDKHGTNMNLSHAGSPVSTRMEGILLPLCQSSVYVYPHTLHTLHTICFKCLGFSPKQEQPPRGEGGYSCGLFKIFLAVHIPGPSLPSMPEESLHKVTVCHRYPNPPSQLPN